MNKCRLSRSNWIVMAAAMLFFARLVPADTPAIVLGSVSSQQPSSYTGTRGWQFEHAVAPTNEIWVTQLGVFDAWGDGLVNSHEVGVWRSNPDNLTGVLLASATVPAGTGAPLEWGYRWAPISPVLIPYGIAPHVVGAQFSAGDDDNLVTPIVSPFTAGLAIWPFIGRGDLGTDLPYPAGSGSELRWQANFQFTFVPEPSVWVLLSPGLLYVLLRGRKSHRRQQA